MLVLAGPLFHLCARLGRASLSLICWAAQVPSLTYVLGWAAPLSHLCLCCLQTLQESTVSLKLWLCICYEPQCGCFVPGPLHRTGAFLLFFVVIIIIIIIVIIIIIKFQDRDSQCSTVFPGTYTRLALNSKILVLCFPSAVIEGMNHHCPTNSCS